MHFAVHNGYFEVQPILNTDKIYTLGFGSISFSLSGPTRS